MALTPLQKLGQSKILVRKQTRNLIEVTFKLTEIFPPNDPEELRLVMRKKALSISSFVSHGTVQTEKEEQASHFLGVMHELRELLKTANTARQLNYFSDKHLAYFRLAISDVITSLDAVTKLLGCFDEG